MILFINSPSSLLTMPFSWNHDLCVEMAAMAQKGFNVGCVDNACLRLNPEIIQAEIDQKKPERVILYGGFKEYTFIKQYLQKLKHPKTSVMGFPLSYGKKLKLPVEKGVLPPKNPDTLPVPFWDVLPLQNYFAYSPIAESQHTITLQRRATYTCSYDGKWQSTKKAAETLRYLRLKYAYDFIVFNDDFSATTQWTQTFVDMLEKYDLLGLFTWSCHASPDKVDPQILDRLREGGCTIVDYGEIDVAKLETDRLTGAIESTRTIGLTPVLRFVIGDPATNKRNLTEATAFMKSQNLLHKPKLAEPYPETNYYTEAVKDLDTHLTQINSSFINNTKYSDIELLGIIELMSRGDLERLEKTRDV